MHNLVGCLTLRICRNNWSRDWPGPCRISKALRYLLYSIKNCCSGVGKALSSLGRLVVRLILQSSNGTVRQNDMELGSHEEQPSLVELTTTLQAEVMKSLYHDSLRKRFSDGKLVRQVMTDLDILENEE